MNIAVVAPEKFAFQDMVCVDLALALRTTGSFTLVPEPVGGEDARILWSGPPATTLDVQVKGAGGIADLSNLVEYLAHYPERASSGSLLERLIVEPNTYAAFVLSARCADILQPLLAHSNRLGAPSPRTISAVLASAFRDEVARRASVLAGRELSALASSRLVDQQALIARPVADFQAALRRVTLVEQETSETIEVRLHATLQRERFESAAIRGVLAHLTDCIGESKKTQADAACAIRDVLSTFAPRALRPRRYKDRGTEQELASELEAQGCLLVAGPPRAGKSWAALAVAERLQEQGIDVRSGTYIDEADRFLSDDVTARRAYVLDDPFGSREPVPDASAQLAKLSALCARLRPGRYLISAQTENVLLQMRGAADLTACRLGAFRWRRLNLLSNEVANAIWRAEAQAQGLPPAAVARVSALIDGSDDLRDPGALSYLAQTWSELAEPYTDEEILVQARRDAIDFARSIAGQHAGAADVLVAAAISTEPARSVAEIDLAFVADGALERPNFQGEFDTLTLVEKDRMPPPAYQDTPALPLDMSHALTVLQRRRVIALERNEFNFTHPYLRAAAQALATPDIPSDLGRLTQKLARALASPSPQTSLAAAQNLRWLRAAFSGNDEALYRLAHEGLRSCFPATRDSCFEFLVRFADQLPEDLSDELTGLAESMIVSLERIAVDGGVGFISNHYDLLQPRPTIAEVRPFLDALNRGEPVALDIALSKRLLQALKGEPAELTINAVRRFLRADEAIVRAAAAKLWLSDPRSDDDDVLDLIERDATPPMGAALLEGVAQAWPALGEARRARLADMAIAQCESPSTASVVYSRAVLFNRVEKFGRFPPWDLFAAVAPRALERLPHRVSLRDGRLNAAVDDALKEGLPELLLPLFEVWARRVVDKAGQHSLDESELSLIPRLLRLAPGAPRTSIVEQLLRTEDTGTRIVTVAALAHAWDALSTDEMECVAGCLRAASPDRHWIAAAALTRPVTPPAILTTLAVAQDSFDGDAAAIEQALGPRLFDACIHMFCGWPQPLWWYGTHHSGSGLWNRVIIELAGQPEHRLHRVALSELIHYGESQTAVNVLQNLPADYLLNTFEFMLDMQTVSRLDWKPPVWQALFLRLSEMTATEAALGAIDRRLDAIVEDVRQVHLWLGDTEIASDVYALVTADVRALRMGNDLPTMLDSAREALEKVNKAGTAAADAVIDTFFNAVVASIEKLNPRLHRTWSRLQTQVSSLGAPSETVERLAAGYKSALQRHQGIRDVLLPWPSEPELVGWQPPLQ
ncbi:hypothetical protein [Xanthomonas sacchari]|uniref:nSTAND3 domain-containing NTPase n=1 Tax=Xanthomonas sacchari TaxID=56458 RepID=UPI002252225F|nr:hypothetical protein [Xanthomonas sacchari]